LPLDAVIWCQTTATLAGLAAWQFGGGLMQWYNVVNWEFLKKKYKEANDKKIIVSSMYQTLFPNFTTLN